MIKNKKYKLLLIALIILISLLIIFANRLYINFKIKPELNKLKGKNVLFITIDGLNNSIINNYKIKNLENLKENGVYFKNCLTPSIQELPSYVSIFTSLYPFQHKIKDQLSGKINSRLYFFKRLKKRNYKAAAFISNVFLSSVFGLNKGFDFYYDKFDILKTENIKDIYIDSNEISNQVINWLQTHNKNKFFLWINYSDLISTKTLPYNNDIKDFTKRYISELKKIDDGIGKIVKFLKEEKIAQDTIIIITAPYSLPLKDTIYPVGLSIREINVPLIIDIPSVKQLSKKEVASNVSTLDILPTISELILTDKRLKRNQIQGKSLLKTILFKTPVRDYFLSENYYPALHFDEQPQFSLIYKHYQYIKGESKELIDLRKKRVMNIEKMSKLIPKLEKYYNHIYNIKSSFNLSELYIDYEIIKRFKEIGYLPPNNKKNNKKLVDTDTINKYFLSRKYFNKELYSKALSILNSSKTINNYFDTNFLRAQIIIKSGNIDNAINLIENLILKYPSNRILLDELTKISIEFNIIKKELDFLIPLLNKTNIKTPILFNIGKLYLRLGDLKEAEKYFKELLQYNPYSPEALLNLGIIKFKQGNFEKSNNLILKSINLKKRIKDACYYLGYLNEKKKDYRKALYYYKTELTNYPYNHKLYLRLALTFIQIGQPLKAIFYLKKYMNLNPDDYRGYFELAKLYFSIKMNVQETIPLILQSIQLCKNVNNLPEIYYLLSDIYKYLGDLKKTKYYYKLGKKIEKYGLNKSPIY